MSKASKKSLSVWLGLIIPSVVLGVVLAGVSGIFSGRVIHTVSCITEGTTQISAKATDCSPEVDSMGWPLVYDITSYGDDFQVWQLIVDLAFWSGLSFAAIWLAWGRRI